MTTTTPASSSSGRLLVQIASYNTALQGFRGVPQDLVDWLSPTLKVSKFLSREPRAPDIVAVGFQELLPLHQGRMYQTYSPLAHPVLAGMISCWRLEQCYPRSQQPHLIPARGSCSQWGAVHSRGKGRERWCCSARVCARRRYIPSHS
jgi:hypothetical protein